MKKITLLLSVLISITSFWQSKAQERNCATELNLTGSQKQQILETMQTDFVAFHNNRTLTGPIAVPVQIHIVRTSAGTGGVAESTVLTELINQVNPKYAAMNMTFTTIGPTNYINSDIYYDISGYPEGQAMSLANSIPNVLNIYFVNDPNGACGWARFSASLPEDYIVIANVCANNTSTLAHEIGHYFDLYHTHETAFGNELVNGTNCGIAGDLLCDTPADPSLTGLVTSFPTCLYAGSGTDANGQVYVPDPSQIMSYSQKQCRVNFTAEAESKVLFTAENARSYLFAPTAVCAPSVAMLDGMGNVALTAANFNAGSTDPNGDALTYSVSPSSFGCADLGVNTITFTVTDPNGFTDTCTTTVTITDSAAVAIVCQNPTISLDGTGSATITATDLDGGSTAGSCGIGSMYMTDGTITTTTLAVNFAPTTSSNGNMFDVVGVNPITIDSFDIHSNLALGTLANFEVYFKTGTWVGSETTAGDWTLVGTATNVPSAGFGVGSPLGLSLGIDVAAGETVAFYVTSSDLTTIRYTNSGGLVGDLWASDANVQVLKGAGKSYPFGSTFQPRNFNGNIIYSKPTIFDGNFDCADIGPNIITFNVTDTGGNVYSCDATVTITDSNPTALTQNPTLSLDASGNTTLTPVDVDNGSANFCGGTPFLAFETTSFAGETTMASPTDELITGTPYSYEASAFTVPVSGNYVFNVTGTNTSGTIFLIIWDDTPVPNSGEYQLRPEYLAIGLWSDSGVFLGGTNTFPLAADKTYYMSRGDANPNNTAVFTTTIDQPVRTTAATITYSCRDIGNSLVTLYAFDAAGNTDSAAAAVTVDGALTTYTAGAWNNGAPNLGSRAVVDELLVSGGSSIEACACDISATGHLVLETGDYLLVDGDITVSAGGLLTVDNGASVVQIDDAAAVTNNGSMLIKKQTPVMAAQSFMVSGSPMTAETREGVFGTSYIVRNHVTANFEPNLAVEVQAPGINNWADDNGNNWLNHTGLLNPGAGYMVFPQPDGSSSDTYLQFHNLGTLNNGIINFNLGFNADQNSSPNIMANPYASAIDAEVFFDDPANSNIDVVYFWEHNTPLSITYPGYNVANFSMADISLYSETLGAGVAAGSGGAVPTRFIASGQGFGVKPTAGGIAQFNNAMRVTGPNDTYRSNDVIARDRLWLKVYNDTYGLGSTTLIGFTETTYDGFINSEDVHRLPTPVSLYSELETGEELVVNALDTFETSDAFYLSFSTQVKETQNYRISIDSLDGVNLEAATVYLIDALMGTVTNLSEGDYTFQSGEAVYHKRFKVVFENGALGIEDNAISHISLYPNPTEGQLNIASPNAAISSVTIFDLQGRKVVSEVFTENNNVQIDISDLNSAMYFVDIKTDAGTVTKRLIKK